MKNLFFITSMWKYRELIIQFTGRDINARFKGSELGMIWSAINPLLMLTVYTFIFSQVFKARWGIESATDGPFTFALNLFIGLILFNIFAECASRSPQLISSNPNYVKKIIFPIEILGIMITGSSIFQGIISLVVLLAIKLITIGTLGLTVIFVPLVWIPFGLGCLGMSWLLATVGVYIKDISQVIASFVSAMMFLSPIFYPTKALPEAIRWMSSINPLGLAIEQTRLIIMEGSTPELKIILISVLVSITWCEGTFRILKYNQKTFGDLL